MKKIIVTLLFIGTTLVYGQEKGYLGLEFGSGITLSDFGSTDFDNDESGFAKNGIYVGIAGTYKIKNGLGIAYSFRYQTNQMDVQEISNYFGDEFPSYSNTVMANSWSVSGGLVGGYASFDINDNVSWDSKILFGFLTAKNPYLSVTLDDGNNQAEYEQMKSSSSAFTYGFSTGLKVALSSKIAVLFNIETMNANLKFTNVETYIDGDLYEEISFNQGYSLFNYGAGLVYRFNK